MKLSLRLVSAVLISSMLLVATATEISPEAVAPRTCETLSGRYKGLCWSSNSCALICREFEQFEGGHCRGFIRQCYCTTKCC
ncbi:defensin-like protein 1 [Eutrema salsugineum]|uniref:Defensin-like protein n=1 Tax=Eutrema halophilum TaxID=98038 RepID=C7SI27_EUTHA|nr:defensin-like protein 1 [Eutrema salsugineum]ACQ90609.1 defensin-like protein [Eutrema halophilum]